MFGCVVGEWVLFIAMKYLKKFYLLLTRRPKTVLRIGVLMFSPFAFAASGRTKGTVRLEAAKATVRSEAAKATEALEPRPT